MIFINYREFFPFKIIYFKNTIESLDNLSEVFDIIVIGAGPGGYHAAIRAAQYGAKVAIVEKDKIGGTCLNAGCIPKQALYASVKIIEDIEKKAGNFGFRINNISLDFGQAVERKNTVVTELVKGIESLLKIWKVEIYRGIGSLSGGNLESGYNISVKNDNSIVNITGKRIIIATGSESAIIADFNIDHKKILTSYDILATDFATVPKSLLIIGGGFIGCEFSNIFARFGSKVIILEYLPTILASEEPSVVSRLKMKFKELGIEIFENQNVLNIENIGSGVRVTACDASIPREQIEVAEKSHFEAEYCIVSIGRVKMFANLGLKKFNIEIEKGAIKVDRKTLETGEKGIYAIGDVIPGIMLAHVAYYEADIAVANALSSLGGFKTHPMEADYSTIPMTISTNPEIGSVGTRSKRARDKGIKINLGRFNFNALGNSKCLGEEEGFMMVLADKDTDKIVGASCIGDGASELIAEIVLAMKNNLSAHQIAETIHSHPTTSEIVLESVEDVFGMSIHKKGHPKLK